LYLYAFAEGGKPAGTGLLCTRHLKRARQLAARQRLWGQPVDGLASGFLDFFA
jgi:hypothetical protein